MKSIRLPLLVCLSMTLALSCVTTKSMMDKGDYSGAYEAAISKKVTPSPQDAERLGDYFYKKKEFDKAVASYEIALGGKNAALVRMGDKVRGDALNNERGNTARLKAVEYYLAGGDKAKAKAVCEKMLSSIRWSSNTSKDYASGWSSFKPMYASEKEASLEWGRYLVGKLNTQSNTYETETNALLKLIVNALEKGGAERKEVVSTAVETLKKLNKQYSADYDKKTSADTLWAAEIVPVEKSLNAVLADKEEQKAALHDFVRWKIDGGYTAPEVRLAYARKIGDASLIRKFVIESAQKKLTGMKYEFQYTSSSLQTSPAKALRESMITDLGDAVLVDNLLGEWLFKINELQLSAFAYESAGNKEKAEVSWRAIAKKYGEGFAHELKEDILFAHLSKVHADPKAAWAEAGDMLLSKNKEAAAHCYLNAGLKEKGVALLVGLAKSWASPGNDQIWQEKAAKAYLEAGLTEEAHKVAEDHLRRHIAAKKDLGLGSGYYYDSVFVAAYGSSQAAAPALGKLFDEFGLYEKALGYYGATHESERRDMILKEMDKRLRAGTDLEAVRDFAWGRFDHEYKISDEFMAEKLPEKKLYNEAYLMNLQIGKQAKAAELLEKAVSEETDPARRLATLGLVSRAGSAAAKKLLPVFAKDADPALSKPASFILGAKPGAKPRVALVNMGLPGLATTYGFLGVSGIMSAKMKAFASEIKRNEPIGFDTQLASSLGAKFEVTSEAAVKPIKTQGYWTGVDQTKLNEMAASGKYDVIVAFWLIPDERSNSNSSLVSVDYRFCASACIVGVGIWESFKTPEFHLGYRPSGAVSEKDAVHAEAAKKMVKNEKDAAKEIASYLKTVFGN